MKILKRKFPKVYWLWVPQIVMYYLDKMTLNVTLLHYLDVICQQNTCQVRSGEFSASSGLLHYVCGVKLCSKLLYSLNCHVRKIY